MPTSNNGNDSKKDLPNSSQHSSKETDCIHEGREQEVKDLDTTNIFEEGEEIIIPVLEEELHIDKEVVESGKIRIIKKVKEENNTVEVPIEHTKVNVERKPINQYVDSNHQAIRHEGNTMIVSVLKEVVVVEKKTLLVEELHIQKTQHQEIPEFQTNSQK